MREPIIKQLQIVILIFLFGLVGCQTKQSDGFQTPESLQISNTDEVSTIEPSVSVDVNERIVFASNRDDNYEIYVREIGSSQIMRLTHNDVNDSYPVWSPDGQQIAFISDRDGNNELYIMTANGDRQTRLTNTRDSESFPRWSPDGQYIAFSSYGEGKGSSISIIHVISKQLTQIVSEEFDATNPSWSPDGQYILYASGQDHQNVYLNELYTVSLNDGTIKRLSDIEDRTTFIYPVWSPDGQKIVFTTNTRPSKIFIMDTDTLELMQLLPYETDVQSIADMQREFTPSWSPDGESLIFALEGENRADIFSFDLESKELTQHTFDPASDLFPDWWQP
jgi:TolB protein